MQRQTPTAARVFNLHDVEADIEAVIAGQQPLRDEQPEDYAPPAVRSPMIPTPAYVTHRDHVNQVGALTAAAVVQQYEETAKGIEAMGEELKDRIAKLEQTKTEASAALAEITETAAAFREVGKRVFLQIEDCSLLTAEVRTTCTALKEKIAAPASA